MALCETDIQGDLERRRPGKTRHTTQRREPDEVQILSGVFEGKTTGTPIALIIYNKDQRSKDYSKIMETFRPGHADYTYQQKYGFRDYRGGGRSSARETVMRVAAGAIARKYLHERYGIVIRGWLAQLGPICLDPVAPETALLVAPSSAPRRLLIWRTASPPSWLVRRSMRSIVCVLASLGAAPAFFEEILAR